MIKEIVRIKYIILINAQMSLAIKMQSIFCKIHLTNISQINMAQ